eukprot:IDg19997t1
MTSPIALLKRHKWAKLTEPERNAVQDCMSIAGTRVAIGVGAVVTTAALIGQGGFVSPSPVFRIDTILLTHEQRDAGCAHCHPGCDTALAAFSHYWAATQVSYPAGPYTHSAFYPCLAPRSRTIYALSLAIGSSVYQNIVYLQKTLRPRSAGRPTPHRNRRQMQNKLLLVLKRLYVHAAQAVASASCKRMADTPGNATGALHMRRAGSTLCAAQASLLRRKISLDSTRPELTRTASNRAGMSKPSRELLKRSGARARRVLIELVKQ